MSMLHFGSRFFVPMLGKKRFFPFWQKVYRFSLRGMNISCDFDCKNNGENIFINLVNQKIPGRKICFDCGANIGDYSLEIMRAFKNNVEIHCFEPSTVTYRILKQNVGNHVKANNVGLSDQAGEMTLYYDAALSPLASLYQRQLKDLELSESEKVQILTIDDYCFANSVSHIDLLKIDVEGNELNVLKGAKKMIGEGLISIIQFEFGGTSLDARIYLRDFWNLLHEKYDLYIILRDGLYKFSSYTEDMELFSYSNYCFSRKDLLLN